MSEAYAKYYTNKTNGYFENVRHDVIKLLPNDPTQSVIEVGAGGGDSLVYIKQNELASYVCGVELMQLQGSNQNHEAMDQFVFANVEDKDLQFDRLFDVLILADVLEHLNDPWDALNYLTTLVKPGGKLLISLPNIREISAMAKIFFKGDFRYVGHGIFDKTHVRFFCKRNMVELIESDGRTIQSIHSNLELLNLNRKRKMLNAVTLKAFEEFLSRQFLFVVDKPSKV